MLSRHLQIYLQQIHWFRDFRVIYSPVFDIIYYFFSFILLYCKFIHLVLMKITKTLLIFLVLFSCNNVNLEQDNLEIDSQRFT